MDAFNDIVNLIIFRIPDEDNKPSFVQLAFKDGKLAEEGYKFSVLSGDSYSDLDFDRIVLAEEIEEGSRSKAVYQIGKSGDFGAAEVYQLPENDLETIVIDLIEQHKIQHAEDIKRAKKAMH